MSLKLNFKFNKRTQFTIYGWIRQINRNNFHIPNVIKNVIGNYFECYDQFLKDLVGKCTIDQDGIRISTPSLQPHDNCQVTGNIKIKQNDIVEWKFQIDKFSNKIGPGWELREMTFGLCYFSNSEKEWGIWHLSNTGYAQFEYFIDKKQGYQNIQHMSINWKENDQLTMRYHQGAISYQVNSKHENELFNVTSLSNNSLTFGYYKLWAIIPYDCQVRMCHFFIQENNH